MKQTKIKSFFKAAAILSTILGLSAPAAVLASKVNFTNTVNNGNNVFDNTVPIFPANIARTDTTVDFLNNQAVTVAYDATVLPLLFGADIEQFALKVSNKTGVEWTHLTVEFIGLAQDLVDSFPSALTPSIPNSWATGSVNVSTAFTGFEVDYVSNIPVDPSVPGAYHFRIANSINNFPSLQNGNPFSLRITPTATTVVPVPAAIWFFGTGMLTLFGNGIRKRRVAKTA